MKIRCFVFSLALAAVFTFMLVSAAITSAQNLQAELYELKFDIIENKVLVTHLISNINLEGNLTISLLADARAIEAKVNEQAVAFNITEKANEKILTISIEPDSTIEISYITNDFLETGKKSYFTAEFKTPIDTEIKKLKITLALPEGSVLADKPSLSVFPAGEIETDGQRIYVIWKYEDVKKDTSLPLFVIFKGKTSNLLVYLIIIISIIIIVLIVYLSFKRKKITEKKTKAKKARKKGRKEKISEAEKIEEHLIESEKAIINALKKAQRHELWQKQIQLQTGFSKAKLSRVIRNLEARNLIKKIPFGNTNKIVLR